MFTVHKVSSDEALRMIQKSIDEANKINKAIAIAVAGPEGELLAFLRMDGANPASAQIAQSKAYTSARDCKSSRAQGEFMRNENREQAYWTDKLITGFGGGLPVYHEGKVIGAIGISGLSEEEDERIAAAAIKFVFGN